MQNALFDRLSSERDRELVEIARLGSELDTEYKRRTVLNCVKEGAIDNVGRTNKYILSSYDDACKNIDLYKKEIEDRHEKLKALEYQMQYIEMVTDNLKNELI